MTAIASIEKEIDGSFASNPLADVPWTQSAWTLLSVVEDHHFKITVVQPLSERDAAIYVDGLANAMTHPLRVLRTRAPRARASLDRRYIEAHYGQAQEWLNAAEDYNHFCSIFPLYHANEIGLSVNGNYLETTDWSDSDLSFEVYDRFVAKRDPAHESRLNGDAIAVSLRTCIRSSGGMYSVDFTRRLMADLQRHISPMFERRHVLPKEWQFAHFSLAQYRLVFMTLQIAAEAWFVARQLVAPRVRGIAYEGSVWTPRKDFLRALVRRHTGLPMEPVQAVLNYLTFGEVGIRNPDVAIQPIIDLGNDHYGISPFLMTQIHAERNLCVLLNQVPEDRKLYAALVHAKEDRIRTDTIQSLQSLALSFKHGSVGRTDVDLAIIDRKAKICLCIELKWFIEPAEIREVLMRSEEIRKGIGQAKLLTSLFYSSDSRLLELLGIDRDYEFQAMVGSESFIGRPSVQDPEVPVTKVWHVAAKIKETGSLRAAVAWLKGREYLPIKGRDYTVLEVPIQCGRWRSRWYGIAYA